MKNARLLLPFAALAVASASAYDLPPCEIPLNCSMQMKTDTFNEATLREIREMGFRMVRRGLYWSAVEKAKGVYDFSSVEPQMKVCKDLGLTVIVTLFSGNKLYEDVPGGVLTEPGRKGFAAFAVAAARKFADQPVMFEIWNEPNVRTFWRKNGQANSDAFAKEYSDLVNEVAPAMVKAVPGVFVVAGSVSNYWEPSYEWTESCFRNGVLKSGIRGWSVHPYGVKTPEAFRIGHGRTRELLKKYGAPDMPILNTERGFTATKRDEGYSGGDAARILDYQAWYFVRQYLTDMIEGVRLTSWYEWKGNEGFSLFENGKPRPAYHAARRMLTELSGYRFRSLVKTESPRDRAAVFANAEGARKLVLWTSAPFDGSPDETVDHAVLVRTSASAKPLEGVGMLGGRTSAGNGFALELTGAPVYLALPAGVEPLEVVNVGEARRRVPAAPANVPAEPGRPLNLCRAGVEWTFIPNTGKGGVSVGKSSDGAEAVFIDWDFSESKARSTPYVMTSVPLGELGTTAKIAFRAKSPIAQGLTLRVTDATGQTLQHRVRIKGRGTWENFAFPLDRKLEHWGGANDGRVHFPVKTLNINVPKPSAANKGRVELSGFETVSAK